MGNSETHNLSPVRKDERKDLDLSRHVSYKQYCRVCTYYMVLSFISIQKFQILFLNPHSSR